MKRTISVWSDRNIRDQLWRWSPLTGSVSSVCRTEMSLSINKIVVPRTTPLYSAYKNKKTCGVGSVQPEWTVPFSMWNFTLEFLLNRKRPLNQKAFRPTAKHTNPPTKRTCTSIHLRLRHLSNFTQRYEKESGVHLPRMSELNTHQRHSLKQVQPIWKCKA